MTKERKAFSDWDEELAAGLVASFEGLRLAAYRCPAGIPTIGYGHADKSMPMTKRITSDEADALLRADLAGFKRHVAGFVRVPVSRGEFVALMSFVFNVGTENLRRSTLLKKLNLGDYKGAGAEFPKWVFAAGKKLGGLVSRREIERKNFDSL